MIKLNYSVVIDAPSEKVWRTMLDDKTYRIWTAVFAPGSHYSGDWSEGSKIYFLAPGEDGGTGGMVSRIAENREYEFISIEHIGMIHNGHEDTSSDEVKSWAGVRENYTFSDEKGKTKLLVEMDTDEEYREMMDKIWPEALHTLKDLCEKS